MPISSSKQATAAVLHRTEFATITHHREAALLVLRWTEASERMGAEGFREVLTRLAEFSAEHAARNLLVDVRKFRFAMTPDLVVWRDQEIAPRYNRAGVDRLAYLVRTDFPIPPFDGKPLSKQEWFRTRFFRAEAEAQRWLLR